MYLTKLEGPATAHGRTRWLQLVVGVLCMALIANLQYGWTLFVRPMHDTMGWPEHDIQTAFTIFILLETWLGPLEGMLVDRFGPRPVVAAGAVLIFIAWTMNAHAHSLPMLYLAAVLSGVGGGSVYGTCVGNALKWFPEKRGFASGLTATGFGVGAALTVVPIANAIKTHGYQSAFSTFAMILGGCILVLSLFLKRAPLARTKAKSSRRVEARHSLTVGQAIKTPVFWMMYVVFVSVSVGGLIATAQLGPMARDYGIAKTSMTLLGATIPLLALTLSVDNLANGLTRPLGGYLSDRFGRENVMAIVFVGEGIALLGLATLGHTPIGFLVFAPMIFLCWGETYAISSALAGDTFGDAHVTANAGALYTTKGVAALLVPLGSLVKETTGDWTLVLMCCGAIAIAVGIASKLVLAPMRRAFIERCNHMDATVHADAGEPHVGAADAAH